MRLSCFLVLLLWDVNAHATRARKKFADVPSVRKPNLRPANKVLHEEHAHRQVNNSTVSARKRKEFRRCTQRPDRGICHPVKLAYYFDINSRSCKPFVSGGCLENTNRFATERQCHNTCLPSQKRRPRCHVHPNSQLCDGRQQLWAFDYYTNFCRRFRVGYCAGSVNHFTTCEACMTACSRLNCFKNCKREKPVPQPTPSICLKPPVLGYCKPLGRAWYFDHHKKECVKVDPALCGTGSNLFGTLEQCKKVCEHPVGQAQIICLTPPVLASSRPLLQSWYFEVDCACCKRLNYTLGAASGNKFSTEIKCQELCKPNHKPKAVCSLVAESQWCLLTTKIFKHWYFDSTKNTCHRFSKGRCAKNSNGFTSLNKCMTRCSCFKPATTLNETQPEPKKRE
ncbi:actinia tenebrosa protease inhibitors-like isoform X3 [Dermacentor variabilis]|uniref:actinia tenebrosa protease inhibitors-like isoform X3 n=1 Tax=Dermacentor variabilis TaxID=34621 RepID=UPI003F5BE84D